MLFNVEREALNYTEQPNRATEPYYFLCTELANSVAEVVENYDSEETYYEGCYDSTNAFNALHPYEVVEAHGVESGPYTMTEVEPQCNEPYEVECAVHLTPDRSSEECLNEASAIGWSELRYREVVRTQDVHNFGELHLEPEVSHVENEEADYDETEHQHVL